MKLRFAWKDPGTRYGSVTVHRCRTWRTRKLQHHKLQVGHQHHRPATLSQHPDIVVASSFGPDRLKFTWSRWSFHDGCPQTRLFRHDSIMQSSSANFHFGEALAARRKISTPPSIVSLEGYTHRLVSSQMPGSRDDGLAASFWLKR